MSRPYTIVLCEGQQQQTFILISLQPQKPPTCFFDSRDVAAKINTVKNSVSHPPTETVLTPLTLYPPYSSFTYSVL